jgi:hypothetical protein
MNVLEFPPKQFFKTKVNLESLYGTCNYVLFLQFSLKLEITDPKTVRDLFILFASYNLIPEDSVYFWRSEPAKSTKFILLIIIFSILLIYFLISN